MVFPEKDLRKALHERGNVVTLQELEEFVSTHMKWLSRTLQTSNGDSF